MSQPQSSTLKNIFSRSFAGANLLEVSLVKDLTPELPFYKPKFFCFISIMPGQQNPDGGRTFVREDRITMKVDCDKIIALSYSLEAWSKGHGPKLGYFTIFSKSQNVNKTCYVSEFYGKGKDGQQSQDPKDRKISISMSIIGNNAKPIGNSFTYSESMAIVDILKFIGMKGIEMDFNERSQFNNIPSGNNYKNNVPSQNFSVPQADQSNSQAYNGQIDDGPSFADVPF